MNKQKLLVEAPTVSADTARSLSWAARQLFASLQPFLYLKRFVVAYSGGVDSHLLLSGLAELKSTGLVTVPLVALHVNHQLQSGSQQWAEHCENICKDLKIEFLTETVRVDAGPGKSLEQQARKARYQVFEKRLGEGDLLLMGHHGDDQVETFFLRLLRGSGINGLAGMPVQRPLAKAMLLRPWLGLSRQQIETEAERQQLRWIEDPSNRQLYFDRNFLRSSVLPLLAERWSAYRATIVRAMALIDESRQLNDELAELDMARLQLTVSSCCLPLKALQQLSQRRLKNLLRYYFSAKGVMMPTAAQLQEIVEQLVYTRPDAEPCVRSGDYEYRCFEQCLYCLPVVADFDSQQCLDWQGQEQRLVNNGCLSKTDVTGWGLRAGHYQVRFRQGGERCQPVGRGRSQTLKKLFQEYRVPTWLRDRVPLLYQGERLAAVAGYWLCEGFQSAANEGGWQLSWVSPYERELQHVN
jgi:tRNA(Ile)-lysidine synthase